jgi:hypothetical protein
MELAVKAGISSFFETSAYHFLRARNSHANSNKLVSRLVIG